MALINNVSSGPRGARALSGSGVGAGVPGCGTTVTSPHSGGLDHGGCGALGLLGQWVSSEGCVFLLVEVMDFGCM